MQTVEHDFHSAEIHPIDIAATLAMRRDWEFDRMGEDELAMAVEGTWRTYAVTLAWRPREESLRLLVSFELDPPKRRRAAMAEAVNRANEACWSGAFALWPDEALMVWRYGLTLAGGASPTPEQIESMLATALGACERFYPAFQLVAWGGEKPEAAMAVAMGDAVGRA